MWYDEMISHVLTDTLLSSKEELKREGNTFRYQRLDYGALRHQAIILDIVGLSSHVFCGIHMKANFPICLRA